MSDIHFLGYDTGWDYDVDQRHELLRDVRALVVADGPIDGILVGGDIAFRAAEAEYDAAHHWLDDLRDACGQLDVGRVWTVPGNHDVDRSLVAKSPVLQQFRREIRDCPTDDLEEMLKARLSGDPVADSLITALGAYNKFAGEYHCSVTCQQPRWYDATLECDGLQVGLLGLNSVLISDGEDSCDDEPGKLVLGSWQCQVQRRDNTINIVIAHHPPNWIRDWATVEPFLRRAHLLLFGHEHAFAARQHVERGPVEIYAGAVAAGRMKGRMPTGPYAPTYNVLTLERSNGDTVHVTVQPRFWDDARTRFDAHPDGISQFDVAVVQPPDGETGGTRTPVPASSTAGPPPRPGNPLAADDNATDVAADLEAAPAQPPAELRRIGSEFMRRPWTDRVAIARTLGVLADHDLQMPDNELFPTILRRIRDAGLITNLIEELDRG